MKTIVNYPVLAYASLGVLLLVANAPSVQAQQPPTNKQPQANKTSQSESNRPRIFRRFREDGQTARNQTARPAGQNSKTGIAGQASGGNQTARSNTTVPSPTLTDLPATGQPPTPQTAQQIAAGSGIYPAIRPPNRIPVPTLAPPLKLAQSQVAQGLSDSQLRMLPNPDVRQSLSTVPPTPIENDSSIAPTHLLDDKPVGPEIGTESQYIDSDFVELTLTDSRPSDFGELPGFDDPTTSSAVDLKSGGSTTGLNNAPFDEKVLRESIIQKEREILQLTQQLQALKRRLAKSVTPSEF